MHTRLSTYVRLCVCLSVRVNRNSSSYRKEMPPSPLVRHVINVYTCGVKRTLCTHSNMSNLLGGKIRLQGYVLENVIKAW